LRATPPYRVRPKAPETKLMSIQDYTDRQQVNVYAKPRLEVIVAKMRYSDLESVARLEQKCHTLSWNANAYTTELTNPNAYYAVAKTADGTLAAYGGIWVVVDEIHVTTIGTEPELRGRGVGEKILLALMAEGIRMGATRGTLEVRESNTAAQGLYKKYGFQEAAKRRQYYSDNRENAIIMWAERINSAEYAMFLRERRFELFGQ